MCLPSGGGSHLVHGALRGLARGEGDEGVAAVGAGHGVHHEAQVPDDAAALEQRDELVLVHVLGDLAAEHLAAGTRRAALPPGWRPAVLTLPCTATIHLAYYSVRPKHRLFMSISDKNGSTNNKASNILLLNSCLLHSNKRACTF